MPSSNRETFCDQYCSPIEAVLVTNINQYWSERKPVLVNRVTSTGCFPLLLQFLRATFPKEVQLTRCIEYQLLAL